MSEPVQLLVGLGNPGPQYEHTRHNAGEDWVRDLARHLGVALVANTKFFGEVGRGTIDGLDTKLLIPNTFMNRSGQAVAALAQFYKIPAEAILVAHDELDLPPGKVRLKSGGGHGGHNGLRDIISALGNNNRFARLRLGIGHPGSAKQVVGYVLQKAPADQRELTEAAAQKATQHINDIVSGNWDRAMKDLHTD